MRARAVQGEVFVSQDLVQDSDYHAARAAEERALAEAAADSNVRSIHEELAREHERLAEAGEREREATR